MEKKRDWFENESFWAQYAPVLFDAQRWAEAPSVAEGILHIIGAANVEGKEGPAILDAGCGPGRISVELAARGARVTGVDIIRPFLNAALESAQDEGVELELVQADLRTFSRPGAFDAAVSLYTSFGYCDTIEEDMTILRNIASALVPGGWFILEMTGREIAVRDFTEGEWFERGGFTVLTEFSVEGAWEGLRSRWMLIDENGRKIDHVFVQRLYSAVELKRLMMATGFSSVEIYGDFDFSPYNEKARTMVLVART
ncbi:MAG: class I SAM-dependent methyltransferase [Spirochaetales bacterium]|nr:class I SAM-dependent methyltransferase [Spirochaetales bacterium]HNQ97001.1 class I SAM-dependent methyltransferase [Treponemataceae bacterium]